MNAPLDQRPDPARRRRALLLGLETQLSPLQVQAALRMWDEGYAVARPMALAEYVNELSERLGHSMQQRHELRVALYYSISRNDVQQGPARATRAAPPAPPPPPKPAPVAPPLPASYVVFARMAGEILQQVQREEPPVRKDFIDALESHARSLKLTPDRLRTLSRWTRAEGGLESFWELADDRLALLIHAMYAAAAEALGPIPADRLLARAAAAAEALPEALKFPPRRLL